MSNPSDSLQSTNFVPESEPGKGDGQGWRLNKDGSVEINGAFIRDATISYHAKAGEAGELRILPGLVQAETTARAEADEALASRIGAATLRVETPGGEVTLGDLDLYDNARRPRPAIAGLGLGISTRAVTAAQVRNATMSLEQLIKHHSRMIEEVEKIDRGSYELLLLAQQNFRTGEALLRELLRKVDTREVDDGK